MKALCCLVVRPLGLHQQATLFQDLKQTISAYMDSPVRLAMLQVVQLTCTQPRLAHPNSLNKLNDLICLSFSAVSSSVAFVVSLSTDT